MLGACLHGDAHHNSVDEQSPALRATTASAIELAAPTCHRNGSRAKLRSCRASVGLIAATAFGSVAMLEGRRHRHVRPGPTAPPYLPPALR